MKSYFATNKSFRIIHIRNLVITPFEQNKEITESQYRMLKASHSKVIDFKVEDSETQDEDVVVTNVESLDLSANVKKALATSGIETIEQLTAKTAQELIDIKGIAQASLEEIVDVLNGMELSLKEAE